MKRLAVFDSGVGGLSIYQHLQKKLPNCDYIFVSDNAAYPYGTKPARELVERVISVVAAIIRQYNPDILVVACNSASTVVLSALRAQFDLPIVGVVPAIKPAAELSVSKVIALLATPATVERDYTEQLISDHAASCQVHKIGSAELVELAEQKLRGNDITLEHLDSCLARLLVIKDLDTIVLACTHFPLLSTELNDYFKYHNRQVILVDSGAAVANRVASLLATEENHHHVVEGSIASQTSVIAVCTKWVDGETVLTDYLLNQKFTQFQLLDI